LGYNGPATLALQNRPDHKANHRTMWQSLLRSWLMRGAGEALRQSARRDPAGDPTPHQPEPAHLGVVCALPLEAAALVDRMAGVVQISAPGWTAHEGACAGRRLVVVTSGPGRGQAAAATEKLLLGHRPQWVVSAGLAGGLQSGLAVGHLLLADRVTDLAGSDVPIELGPSLRAAAAAAGCRVGTLLTVDRVVRAAAEKRALGETHQALAVDMETLAVAQACRAQSVRFLALRVICDTVDHELPADVDFLLRQSSLAGRLGAATGSLWRRPGSIKDLWQLKEHALVGAERLAETLTRLVPDLVAE
jgi:adenosylhomocysteine nucleosidase